VTERGVVGSAIEIGGDLSEAAIFDLLAAAEEDGAVLGGRHAEYDEEDLRVAVARPAPLRFTRANAAAEEFVELEAFCHAQRLAYRRFGDGGPTGQPGVVFWSPDGEAPTRAPADARGRVYLTLAELDEAAARGLDLAAVLADLRSRSGLVPPLVIRPDAGRSD
jgi:hypothetical protein